MFPPQLLKRQDLLQVRPLYIKQLLLVLQQVRYYYYYDYDCDY